MTTSAVMNDNLTWTCSSIGELLLAPEMDPRRSDMPVVDPHSDHNLKDLFYST